MGGRKIGVAVQVSDLYVLDAALEEALSRSRRRRADWPADKVWALAELRVEVVALIRRREAVNLPCGRAVQVTARSL